MWETFEKNPRLVPALIVVICAGSLAGALVAEHWGGLKPCVLCYYQRYAYLAALLCGLLGFLLAGRPAVRRGMIGLAGLCFLSGATIAAFHVGVEQHWWRGTAECHAPALDFSASVDDLREQLLATDFVPCDQIPWEMFGISMAGYNVIASLAFAVACWFALRGSPRASAV